jgi:hypothetical protein
MATQRKATTPAPTRPARKRATAPKTVAAASTAPIKLYTKQSNDAVEMTPLFSIDDVDYLIPVEPNAIMALRYIEQVKQGLSEEMAMGYLLEDLLGAEAYMGLLAFKGHMSPKQFVELFTAAQNALVGLVEIPKGN